MAFCVVFVFGGALFLKDTLIRFADGVLACSIRHRVVFELFCGGFDSCQYVVFV